MVEKPSGKKFDELKDFNGKIYSGMAIGQSHHWNYNNGKWFETKEAPDRWKFQYKSLKTRTHLAPVNTGAEINTQYHWYILADQIATKVNTNTYKTYMKGVKFKIGHKRPNWKNFSYTYPQQISYKEKVIMLLEYFLRKLKNEI